MTEDQIFDVLRQGLWIGVKSAAPLLLAALITGVAIGLFQALTSVQEMTLTFVPKVAAMLVVFWASMSFMTGNLVDFFQDVVITRVATGGD